MLDKREGEAHSRLRAVPPSELNADVVAEEATSNESRDAPVEGERSAGETWDIVADDGTVIMKNNRLTIDDASRQALSYEEIEELKRTAAGKDVIEKILANHAGLDEKTSYSKAKYTLRKTKKYLKRFTVLPMEIGYLAEYIMEKEPSRIMEIREETLGLVTAWSNAHFSEPVDNLMPKSGRWLVVDDTGGLVVAAIAERMGLLHHDSSTTAIEPPPQLNGAHVDAEDAHMQNGIPQIHIASQNGTSKPVAHNDFPTPAGSNSITLLHAAVQPNVSLLKYFDYDSNNPNPDHPLHTRLKPLSWLQLVHPDEDPTYREPEVVDPEIVDTWKSGKRGNYFRKRRRWERCKAVVDDAREGQFDGLVVASHMDPETTFPHLIPLVRGGGHVVVYSPTIESLVHLTDLYSKDRRTAYLAHLNEHPGQAPDHADFPVDPRLLLAPTLQTSRVRDWQVLPGRTHPLMTSKGGSEGYVFTARRVIPLEGGVEARGKSGKRRKVEADSSAGATPAAVEPILAG